MRSEAIRRLRLKPAERCDTVLLSYPRSGNHALRFLVETVTGHPTLGHFDSESRILVRGVRDVPVSLRDPKLGLSKRTPLLVKRHHLKPGDSFDRLVYLARDPVEAILSHTRDLDEDAFSRHVNAEVERWIELRRIYDMWDPEKRLSIDYADLIEHPDTVIETLLQFLGWGGDRLAVGEHWRDTSRGVLTRPAESHRQAPYSERFPARAITVTSLLGQREEASLSERSPTSAG